MDLYSAGLHVSGCRSVDLTGAMLTAMSPVMSKHEGKLQHQRDEPDGDAVCLCNYLRERNMKKVQGMSSTM